MMWFGFRRLSLSLAEALEMPPVPAYYSKSFVFIYRLLNARAPIV